MTTVRNVPSSESKKIMTSMLRMNSTWAEIQRYCHHIDGCFSVEFARQIVRRHTSTSFKQRCLGAVSLRHLLLLLVLFIGQANLPSTAAPKPGRIHGIIFQNGTQKMASDIHWWKQPDFREENQVPVAARKVHDATRCVHSF